MKFIVRSLVYAAVLSVSFVGVTAFAQGLIDPEPFEALAEQAFSIKGAKLDALIKNAELAAQNAQTVLLTQAKNDLQQRILEIQKARQANKPHEIALAAVEGYRIFVNEVTATKVPKAVSLLDYAGFRYNADLKSKPPRWDDMREAVNFAQVQWTSISAQVSDKNLRGSVEKSLNEMSKAVSIKSGLAAGVAVKTELDLVDKIENYFNRL